VKSFGGFNPKGFIRSRLQEKYVNSNWSELMKNFNVLSKAIGYWDMISGGTNPNSVPVRDSSGRIQASDPVNPQDVATLNYLNTSSSVTPTANTLAKRDSAGKLFGADPASTDTQGLVTVNYYNTQVTNNHYWARVKCNVNITVGTTWTAVPVSTILQSAGTGWTINTSGNLVVPVAGDYILVLTGWGMSTNILAATFYLNGTLYGEQFNCSLNTQNTSTVCSLTTISSLAANSTIEGAAIASASSTLGGEITLKVIKNLI
jgi:hypothetical protein